MAVDPLLRLVREVKDRVVRTETRIVKLMEAGGVPVASTPPEFKDGDVVVTSMATSIGDILRAVPSDWDPANEIGIVHLKREVATFFLP